MAYTLKDRITQSDTTLGVVCIASSIVWLWGAWSSRALLYGLLVCLLTAFVIVEWNNHCQLIRVRSRMSSCSWLLVMLLFPQLHTWTPVALAPIVLIFVNLLLMDRYQRAEGEGQAFYAFLLLGTGGLTLTPLFWAMVLPLWWSMASHLRILTLRTWVATLLGLLLPLWVCFLGCYGPQLVGMEPLFRLPVPTLAWHSLFSGETAVFWHTLFSPNYPKVLAVAFFGLLTVWTYIHYRNTNYKDSIRTRQYFGLITGQALMALFWIFFLGGGDVALRILIALVAPFVAHYFALTERPSGNFFFWLWTAAYIYTLYRI